MQKKVKTKNQNKQNLSSVLNEILPFNQFFSLNTSQPLKERRKKDEISNVFLAVSGRE